MDVREKASDAKDDVKDDVKAKAADARSAGVAVATALGAYLATHVKHLGAAKAGRLAVRGVAKAPLLAAAVLACAGAVYLWNRRRTTGADETGTAAAPA